MLGHDGPPAGIWRENIITGEPLARCPVRTIQLAHDTPVGAEFTRYLTTYFPAYEDGFLLEPGGIGAQPARYLAILGAIREMNNRMRAKDEEFEATQKEG
jgi:hypothetical protein